MRHQKRAKNASKEPKLSRQLKLHREMKRGLAEHFHSDLMTNCVYRRDKAQQDYEKNRSSGRQPPKHHLAHPLLQTLSNAFELAIYPYSSFERGSNENANRLIRRILPKGSTFDKLRQRDVQRLAVWMNKIPRKILESQSARDRAKTLGLDFMPAKC